MSSAWKAAMTSRASFSVVCNAHPFLLGSALGGTRFQRGGRAGNDRGKTAPDVPPRIVVLASEARDTPPRLRLSMSGRDTPGVPGRRTHAPTTAHVTDRRRDRPRDGGGRTGGPRRSHSFRRSRRFHGGR